MEVLIVMESDVNCFQKEREYDTIWKKEQGNFGKYSETNQIGMKGIKKEAART